MSAVTTMGTDAASEHPLIRADLDAVREEYRDDGRRYELLDGVLLVSPSPKPLHQRVVGRLFRLLDDACPAGFEVMLAPLDVVLDDDTVLQPDVLVGRCADFTDDGLASPPLLVVEVLSPSTRRFDQLLKRARYEAAGAGAYWTVDPHESVLEAWTLDDGGYIRAGMARGEEEFRTDVPFPLALAPASLVSRQRR